MKLGLCLEGGAMKGLYTAAILDYFLENKITFQEITGVSAGALFGVNYKSKQLGRALRYNLKYCDNIHYMGIYSFITTGNVMNRKFCFDTLVNKLDIFDFNTYNTNTDVNLTCVVANCKKGIAEYKKLDDLKVFEQMEYLRATGSMPYVSKMVKVNKEKYLDGAIYDSIPVSYMLKHCDVDKLVVILTKVKGYEMKKYNPLITHLRYPFNPLLAKGIINRYQMYNEQIKLIEKLEQVGKIFVIRPSEDIQMSRIENDKSKLQKVYDLGLKDIKDNIEKLNEFLRR